jgi:hypothetical protein
LSFLFHEYKDWIITFCCKSKSYLVMKHSNSKTRCTTNFSIFQMPNSLIANELRLK